MILFVVASIYLSELVNADVPRVFLNPYQRGDFHFSLDD